MNWSLCGWMCHQRTFIWHFIVSYHPLPHPLLNTPGDDGDKHGVVCRLVLCRPFTMNMMMSVHKRHQSGRRSSAIQIIIKPLAVNCGHSLIVKSICSRPMIYEWPTDHSSSVPPPGLDDCLYEVATGRPIQPDLMNLIKDQPTNQPTDHRNVRSTHLGQVPTGN